MRILSNLRVVASLCVLTAVAVGLTPGCTVDESTDGDNEGGESSGGKASGGKTSASGGQAGDSNEGGSTVGQGGQVSQAGDTSTGGTITGSGGDTSSAGNGGNGGAAGAPDTCWSPAAGHEDAEGKSCADYCSSFFAKCAQYNTINETFADEATCLTYCTNYGEDQLCCRLHFVSLPTANCNEAAGDSATCN